MRAAPAVRVTLQPPRLARAGVASLVALACTSFTAWLAALGGAHVAWGLIGLLPGACAGWVWGPRRPFELAWDGQHWSCDGVVGQVAVHLDLQSLLLVRWMPLAAGRARWLLPHRAGAGSQWHALRVALFALRPEAPVDPAGQPPLTP